MSPDAIQTDVRSRAVELIEQRFGPLSDLPEQLRGVIWVTVYRSCEVAIEVERNGGSKAILKSALVGGGVSGYEFEMALRKLQLLQEMIPIIRQSRSKSERNADAQLLTDILKWGIRNAGELSPIRRALARTFARADPLYAEPMPSEVL